MEKNTGRFTKKKNWIIKILNYRKTENVGVSDWKWWTLANCIKTFFVLRKIERVFICYCYFG